MTPLPQFMVVEVSIVPTTTTSSAVCYVTNLSAVLDVSLNASFSTNGALIPEPTTKVATFIVFFVVSRLLFLLSVQLFLRWGPYGGC